MSSLYHYCWHIDTHTQGGKHAKIPVAEQWELDEKKWELLQESKVIHPSGTLNIKVIVITAVQQKNYN